MQRSEGFFDLPVEQQIDRATQAAHAALAGYDLPIDVRLEVLKHRENTVFAINDPSDRKLGAMRVHVPGYQDLASIHSELQWMAALTAAGVRAPGVIAARDGAVVVEGAVAATSETRLVDVLEWIEGRQPRDDEIAATFGIVGELQAKCHNQARGWQLPAGFTRQRWDDTTLPRCSPQPPASFTV